TRFLDKIKLPCSLSLTTRRTVTRILSFTATSSDGSSTRLVDNSRIGIYPSCPVSRPTITFLSSSKAKTTPSTMSPGLISTDASRASDILSTSVFSSGVSVVSSVVSSTTSSGVSSTVSSVSTVSSIVSSTSPFTSNSLFSFSDIFPVPPNTNQYIYHIIFYYIFHSKTTFFIN